MEMTIEELEAGLLFLEQQLKALKALKIAFAEFPISLCSKSFNSDLLQSILGFSDQRILRLVLTSSETMDCPYRGGFTMKEAYRNADFFYNQLERQIFDIIIGLRIIIREKHRLQEEEFAKIWRHYFKIYYITLGPQVSCGSFK